MKKIIVSLLVVVLASSCALNQNTSHNNYYPSKTSCPNVVIPRESAYMSQMLKGFDDFQVSVVGFEGYCYFDDKIKSYKAVITPIFEVAKLGDTKDTQIDFKFFTQTVVGPPEYIGKWSHLQSAYMDKRYKKMSFKGKQVELRIPSVDQDKFEIVLGLVQSLKEKEYNHRTFDIKPEYMKEQ